MIFILSVLPKNCKEIVFIEKRKNDILPRYGLTSSTLVERSLSEGEGLSFLRLADSLFSLGMSCWLWGIEILNWIENWYKIFWMILSSVPFYVYMYQRFSPLFVEKWNIIVFKCQCIYGKMKYSFCIYLCYWPIDILYLNYNNDFIRRCHTYVCVKFMCEREYWK